MWTNVENKNFYEEFKKNNPRFFDNEHTEQKNLTDFFDNKEVEI